jgi:hypothetical protein
MSDKGSNARPSRNHQRLERVVALALTLGLAVALCGFTLLGLEVTGPYVMYAGVGMLCMVILAYALYTSVREDRERVKRQWLSFDRANPDSPGGRGQVEDEWDAIRDLNRDFWVPTPIGTIAGLLVALLFFLLLIGAIRW